MAHCNYCNFVILFNDLWRFLGEIETNNLTETESLTVSKSEIITLDFTVSNKGDFVKSLYFDE